jgi:hypothetical protein
MNRAAAALVAIGVMLLMFLYWQNERAVAMGEGPVIDFRHLQ